MSRTAGCRCKEAGRKGRDPKAHQRRSCFHPSPSCHPVILSFFPLASRASAGFRISPVSRIPSSVSSFSASPRKPPLSTQFSPSEIFWGFGPFLSNPLPYTCDMMIMSCSLGDAAPAAAAVGAAWQPCRRRANLRQLAKCEVPNSGLQRRSIAVPTKSGNPAPILSAPMVHRTKPHKTGATKGNARAYLPAFPDKGVERNWCQC